MTNQPPPIAVVTGATGGIGRWIALGLARAGHHVVLIGRDAAKAQAARDWIALRTPGASMELRLVDLTCLRATRTLGQEIVAAHPRINLLVNNAGMFSAKRKITAEGHEAVLTVNHLAPFVLTDALERALRDAAPSRIVNVGSSTSDRATIDPDDLELARRWGMVRAYAQSKLAMMMATFARAERLRGTGIVANVVHPGAVATGLIKERGPIGLGWRIMAPFQRTEEQGADSPLHVALAPEWATMTGLYIKDRKAVRPNIRACNSALIRKVDAATQTLIQRTVLGDARDAVHFPGQPGKRR
jgi:NAD(P)-dependent dehydrogenase (short-subunit alcohol dehydrogenase family)